MNSSQSTAQRNGESSQRRQPNTSSAHFQSALNRLSGATTCSDVRDVISTYDEATCQAAWNSLPPATRGALALMRFFSRPDNTPTICHDILNE